MSSQGATAGEEQAVIKCESVFKIFGKNAKSLLESADGTIDAEAAKAADCIVGVNNASFEVRAGELLVIMGLSGSGKSTLLRCISKLTDATAGRILVEGDRPLHGRGHGGLAHILGAALLGLRQVDRRLDEIVHVQQLGFGFRALFLRF